MTPTPRDLVRRQTLLRGEEGFGIVEALVAAVILVLAALAIYSAYDASSRATVRARQTQVELSWAQQEMEQIRAFSYQQIALTSLPASSTDSTSPLFRVQGGQFNLNRSGSPNYANLVVNGGTNIGGGPIANGAINPGPERFQSGTEWLTVWRFVVWQKDNGCTAPACTGQDVKRVIIAVKPDSPPGSAPRNYVEIHSDFIDPQSNSLSNIPPNGGPLVTAQQFWLSDTPCNPNGPTVRQPITADHALHNTFSDCSAGMHTGATPGAPDALVTSPPPGIVTDPYFDYSSDWLPNPPPPPTDPKKGIQIVPEAQMSPPCKWQAAGTANPQRSFHEWLSDPMPTGGPFQLTGRVTLSFFSRTLSGAQYPGKICIWLFRLTPGNSPPKFFGSSASTTSPSWTYTSSPNNWPPVYTDSPNEAPPAPLVTTAILSDNDLQVTPNSRLGLAISVASDVTPGPLELMYDHPEFPSRLEIDTTTPLG